MLDSQVHIHSVDRVNPQFRDTVWILREGARIFCGCFCVPLCARIVSETTGGTVTHAQGVSCTQAADIRWYSTNNCSDQNSIGCTSFEGMRGPTILAVLRLKLNTNCSITVSGGTEVGHTTSVTNSHQNGYKADIFNNSCIDSWITQKPSYSNPNSSYPSYRDSSGGPIYNDEPQTSQPHWDIEVP